MNRLLGRHVAVSALAAVVAGGGIVDRATGVDEKGRPGCGGWKKAGERSEEAGIGAHEKRRGEAGGLSQARP